jgi:hypothetical protein
MTEQFRHGDDVDKGIIMGVGFQFILLHDNTILYADKNHVQQPLEEMSIKARLGHQYFVLMDPSNGQLKRRKMAEKFWHTGTKKWFQSTPKNLEDAMLLLHLLLMGKDKITS